MCWVSLQCCTGPVVVLPLQNVTGSSRGAEHDGQRLALKEDENFTSVKRSSLSLQNFFARDPEGLPNWSVNHPYAAKMAPFDHAMPR